MGLGFWRRAFLMATIGLVATIDIDGSYWNWYGFPTSYLLAQFVDHVGGWFLAGLVFSALRRDGGMVAMDNENRLRYAVGVVPNTRRK